MKNIHANHTCIWNKSTKNLKETLKALGGVDFTKYALPTIIVYKQWSRNGYVEKCCKFVKNHFFSIIIIHAHLQYVWNMPAKY